ncbi:Endoglucanase E1 precursor [Microbacterium azadirachtae]|uniref:Endoglucanase E1 n=1 Tax=Microbacterium azadirachtae TaxID=582680 RepID=A0A0F0L2E5_9MICO|nr:cellulase family glycosylhydrolase [Microbacterium azadirachtae]KJL27303.1 Endoglucanase E1 precursor [Microbacterium azadirachtae]
MQRRRNQVLAALGAAALATGLAAPIPAAAQPQAQATSAQARATTIPVLTGAELSASWTAPLSTRGRYVVDADGDRFKLISANWDGAQGHWSGSGSKDDPATHNSGDSYDIPMGLDRVALPTLMSDFHSIGINSIRLPFSNEMLGMTAAPDAAVAANPQLRGKTPLQVFDAVVDALTADGFAVILNNHTTTSLWCCGVDANTKWYSSQTTEKWISDWVMLAQRYRANPRVVGMDLRNEVRRDVTDDANWGMGDGNDLYKAYQQAAIAIQKVSPDVLIVMEGINWQGVPLDGLFHDRPMLKPVANTSNTILHPDKLVYSAHVYGYTGPQHTGATGLGETHDLRYRDMTATQLADAVTQEALFVTTAGQHYTAPVWISEFGIRGAGETDQKNIDWWNNFTDLLAANDTDFAAWPLVTQADAAGDLADTYALLGYRPDGSRISIADDWRYAGWQKLVTSPGRTGHVDPAVRWNMLGSDSYLPDTNASALMQDRPDWDPGQWKGVCPDTERLQGLSRSSNRGLCTDAGQPSLTTVRHVVSTEANVQVDWAGGYSKLQCANGEIAVGLSLTIGTVNRWAASRLLCAPSASALPSSNGRTLWFDRADNRPAGGGSTASDWAPGRFKGQCADGEYIAGVAYTYQRLQGGVPSALLCKPLH